MTELSVDEFTLEFNDRHGRDYAPQEHQAIELYVDGGLRAAHYIRTSTREGSHFYTFTTQSLSLIHISPQYNFNEAPERGAYWFERAMTEHKEDIVSGVQAIVGGGGNG